MSTFDLVEVQGFVADLDARMVSRLDDEGMEFDTFDDALRHHAGLCREFHELVRQWGREVFAGRVALDPEVERTWQAEGWQLYHRARELLDRGPSAEQPGPHREGRDALLPALHELHRFLAGWVTPKLAVGPSARRAGNRPEPDEVRHLIESLPPLPADWQPDDPEQRERFRKLRMS